MTKTLENSLDATFRELFSFLQTLVEISSHTTNKSGVNAVQDVLEREFTALGLLCERIPAKDHGDQLIARSACPGSAMLLVGHADTVHRADSGFDAFRRDGETAFGPGVMDMKGGLTVLLWALKLVSQVRPLNELPIQVLIISDEETGSPSSLPTVKQICKNSAAALVYEWGRDGDTIITRRKALYSYKCEITGTTAHTGNDHSKGVNAIRVAADQIQRLEAFTSYEKGITCNVGTISGGNATNVVPDRVEYTVEIRTPEPGALSRFEATLSDLIAEAEARNAHTVFTKTSSLPPLLECEESLALAHAYNKCGKNYGLQANITKEPLGGGSTANFLSGFGVPCIDGLGPYGENAHSNKECLHIPSLKPRVLSTATFLLEHFK